MSGTELRVRILTEAESVDVVDIDLLSSLVHLHEETLAFEGGIGESSKTSVLAVVFLHLVPEGLAEDVVVEIHGNL